MQTERLNLSAKDHHIASRVAGMHKSLIDRLELGPTDIRSFVEHLLNPRDPAELPALQQAIQRYQQSMKS